MNPESLGKRLTLQESDEPKEGTMNAHVIVRNQQRNDHNSQCRNGLCEVVWKPASVQHSLTNNTVQ